jgi:DNA-directed RNA polymerase specialized sigma subunit
MQTEITTSASRTNDPFEPKLALEDYLPLVRFLAESIQVGPLKDADIDDLYAVGLEGLREAYASFEPGRNVRFVNYAQMIVRTAIEDYARHRWDSANETDHKAAIHKIKSSGDLDARKSVHK